MLACPNCRAALLDGTMFCDICGASVATEARPATAAMRNAADGTGPVLVVLASGQRLGISRNQEETLLGRPDDARKIYPDIDLGEHGGYEAGVSRRHAIILVRDGMLLLEDLNSGNGTFLNGRRLAPFAPQPLSNGDEIKFATLKFRVEGL